MEVEILGKNVLQMLGSMNSGRTSLCHNNRLILGMTTLAIQVSTTCFNCFKSIHAPQRTVDSGDLNYAWMLFSFI